MAAQTYNSLQAACLAATVKAQPPYTVAPPDFAQLFPQATSYAEGRIYKDIVLLATREQDTSLTTTGGVPQVSIVSTQVIIPEGLGLNNSGSVVPYDMATIDVINQVWPTASVTAPPSLTDWNPRYWALLDNQTVYICPTPDAAYTVVLTGLFQPTPIGPSNQSTYLSTVYPELLEMAIMIFLTGPLLHNWSAQSDDPRMALSYESQYQTLMAGAKNEERRRRGLQPDLPMPTQAKAA